jgi:uncharacterized membrane protein YkoI
MQNTIKHKTFSRQLLCVVFAVLCLTVSVNINAANNLRDSGNKYFAQSDQADVKRNEQKRNEQKRNEQRRNEQKRAAQKRNELKRNEFKRNEQKRNEQRRNEQKRIEQKRSEQKRSEQRRSEQSRNEQNLNQQKRNNETRQREMQQNLIDTRRSRSYRDSQEQRTDVRVSLDQAVSMIRQSSGGRVIKANTSYRNGRPVHNIRVLSDNKRVHTYRIDAVSGRRL